MSAIAPLSGTAGSDMLQALVDARKAAADATAAAAEAAAAEAPPASAAKVISLPPAQLSPGMMPALIGLQGGFRR